MLAEERSPRPSSGEIGQFGSLFKLLVFREILEAAGSKPGWWYEGASHLGISSQGVEQLLGCLVTWVGASLPEARSNLIKGPAFSLRNFEVGEDEEQN